MELKYVIVVGIGGSNLGAKAIYDAIYGYFDVILPRRFPKIIFSDTTDPEFAERLDAFIRKELQGPEEALINIISKSGGTTETIANAELLFDAFAARFSGAADRFVVTTDDDSPLSSATKSRSLTGLSVPKNVGGRFSLFSAVGLFPLLLCGIDIKKLRLGAQAMRVQCLLENKNPALESAVALYLGKMRGYTIHDTFLFHPELESLGKWYRQLAAESLGKEKDLNGTVVREGFTPTVSVGSTDLHSVGQLYFGGPKDKITTLVRADPAGSNTPNGANENIFRLRIPRELVLGGHLPELKGKSPSEIMNAIFEGVKIAYQKAEMPFMEVGLGDISEYSLGEFLQFKMFEVMYLGKLFNVNAFDQPNVESYKTETRIILQKKTS